MPWTKYGWVEPGSQAESAVLQSDLEGERAQRLRNAQDRQQIEDYNSRPSEVGQRQAAAHAELNRTVDGLTATRLAYYRRNQEVEDANADRQTKANMEGARLNEQARQFDRSQAQQAREFAGRRWDQMYQSEAQRSDRAYEFDAGHAQQQRQFDATQRQQRDLTQFQADRQDYSQERQIAAQSAQSQQQFYQQLGLHYVDTNNRAWLQQQELTQKEEARMRSLQDQISAVMFNPNLNDIQRNDLVMQLRTGLDGLKERYQASQAKHIDMQNKLLEMKVAHETDAANRRDAMRGMAAEDRKFKVTDPETGAVAWFLENGDKAPIPLPGFGAKSKTENMADMMKLATQFQTDDLNAHSNNPNYVPPPFTTFLEKARTWFGEDKALRAPTGTGPERDMKEGVGAPPPTANPAIPNRSQLIGIGGPPVGGAVTSPEATPQTQVSQPAATPQQPAKQGRYMTPQHEVQTGNEPERKEVDPVTILDPVQRAIRMADDAFVAKDFEAQKALLELADLMKSGKMNERSNYDRVQALKAKAAAFYQSRMQ